MELPNSRLWDWLELALLKKQQKAIIQPLQLSFALPNDNLITTIQGGGMLDTIYVCTHALDRWRERAAERLDAPEEEVIEKLRASRKIAHDEYLPVPRLPNTHYYHHKEHDAYFVVEPIDMTSCRIITVIVPEPVPKNYIIPKKKKKPLPTPVSLPAKRIHVPTTNPDTLAALSVIMQRVLPDDPVPNDWNQRVVDYRRYSDMMREIELQLRGVAKKDPLRNKLIAQLNAVKQKLEMLKPDYRKYLADTERLESENPIRSDGSVNFSAAILALMKRVDEQQKEIEELKNAVAFLSAK